MLTLPILRGRRVIARPVGALIAVLLGFAGVGAALPAYAAGSSAASAGAPTVATATTATTASDSVSMTVTPGDLGALQTGQALRLSLTVSNRTAQDVDAGTLSTTLNRRAVDTRAELANWFSASDKSISATAAVASQPSPFVPAGATRLIDITVPATALKLRAAGVYAVEVTLTTGDAAVADARNAIVWKGTQAGASVPLAVAVPLVVPSVETGLISSESLAQYTADDGMLTEQLDAVIGTPVAIGIDPRILASIRVLGTSAPASATQWLERLRLVSNDTFPLSYADSDVTAPLQAGARSVQRPSSFTFAMNAGNFPATPDTDTTISPAGETPGGTPTNTATPTPTIATNPALPTMEELLEWNYTLPRISWPASNSVITRDLRLIARTTPSAVLLSSSNVSRETIPGGAGTAATIGKVKVGVVDDSLSSLMRSAVEATNSADWSAAVAKVSASMALISEISSAASDSDTVSAAPTMLATLARSWPANDTRLDDTLNAVLSRPWVTGSTLSSALAGEASEAKLVQRPQSEERLKVVGRLLASEAAEKRFAVIVADQDAMTSPRHLDMLGLLANAWRAETDAWSESTQNYVAESRKIRTSVQVADSSNVTSLNNQGAIPVTVSNSLSQAVTVYVTVRPQTAAISVTDSLVKAVVEPDSQRLVRVPFESLSNGQVRLSVSLYDVEGRSVGLVKTVELDVQAGWETAGTFIFAAFVVIIFAAGTVRTIRRRRKARAAQ